MRCIDIQLLTSAYLDEELRITERETYRAHLTSCLSCHQHLEETREVSGFLKAARTPEVPRELRGYVMTAIVRRVHHDIS